VLTVAIYLASLTAVAAAMLHVSHCRTRGKEQN
jgi:hypothetical protein